MFATCCHGLCEWNEYVGRSFLRDLFLKIDDTFVLDDVYFDAMKRWACCGATCTTNSSNDLKEEEGEHANKISNGQDNEKWNIQQVINQNNLSCTKPGLGRMCQRLIDYGRMEYMKQVLKIKNVNICHYVSDDITPQNALIIGFVS